MAKNIIATAGMLTVLSLVSFSARADAMSAQDFVKKASIGGEFEIESSQLDLTNGQDSNVKGFAQRMIYDHSKIGQQLGQVLQGSGASAPQVAFDKKHQKMIDKLKTLNGSEFDHQYMVMQEGEHSGAVKLFTNYSTNGGDATLKNFAAAELPIIKDHVVAMQKLHLNH